MAAMTQEEENAFLDSFIDYTGGTMPLTSTDSIPAAAPQLLPSDALDLLGVQVLLMRLDAVRSMSGQGTTPLLELMRAKIDAQEVAPSGPQAQLLEKLLALPPAECEPVALAQTACTDLTMRLLAKGAHDSFAAVDTLPGSSHPASVSPSKRRKLHTPADQLTNDGRSLCPVDLDPGLPAPDLTNPVWVSCFTDTPGWFSEVHLIEEPEPQPSLLWRSSSNRSSPRSSSSVLLTPLSSPFSTPSPKVQAAPSAIPRRQSARLRMA
ncbi:hypothetical protein C8R47DRAFT_226598 [Mycena vitilis]|nr:hypothetical protein C8R47DRAFT_226598 [Mycena vitilis]